MNQAVQTNENQAIIAAVERLTLDRARMERPEFRALDSGETLLVFRDAKGDLVREALPEKPARPQGHLVTHTVAGFAEAVAQLRSSDPARSPLVRFHAGGVEAVLNRFTADRPDYGDHVVRFDPTPSPEWTRWLEFTAKLRARREASAFVEDNAADFAAPTEGCVAAGALRDWLASLTLKAVREIDQSDNADGDRTTTEGSATLSHVTRLVLRVHECGPAIGFRCRWRAQLDPSGALVVVAKIVNVNEAERRVWHGPVPDGAGWKPLVEQVRDALALPVIV